MTCGSPSHGCRRPPPSPYCRLPVLGSSSHHASARHSRPCAPAGPDPRRARPPARAARLKIAGDLERLFHPAVAAWFAKTFPAPTPAQTEAWAAIKAGRPTLIAAPTGSGKTLAAFLAAIDDLVRQGARGRSADETQVVYVSPLKALSNDIRINLDGPLEGVRAELAAPRPARCRDQRLGPHRRHDLDRAGEDAPPRAAYPRHHAGIALRAARLGIGPQDAGDDALGDRRRDPRRRAEQARRASGAVARTARGALRRQAAAHRPLRDAEPDRRGGGVPGRRRTAPANDVAIVDAGHQRAARPRARSSRLAARSGDVERGLDRGLRPAGGADQGASHDARLRQHAPPVRARGAGADRPARRAARSRRITAACRRSGGSRPSASSSAANCKAMVATASLELGIDIGEVDLVCQIGSPRSIATFLQRVGRSGHAIDGTPKGRLFPLSRDDLVECAALLDSVRRGELDRLVDPAGRPRRALAADRRRSRRAGLGGGRALRAPAPRVSPTATSRARLSTRSSRCWPKVSRRATAGAARSSIAMRSTACCAAGAARG